MDAILGMRQEEVRDCPWAWGRDCLSAATEREFPVSLTHRDARKRLREQRPPDASQKAAYRWAPQVVQERQAELVQKDVPLQALPARRHVRADESELRQAR